MCARLRGSWIVPDPKGRIVLRCSIIPSADLVKIPLAIGAEPLKSPRTLPAYGMVWQGGPRKSDDKRTFDVVGRWNILVALPSQSHLPAEI